MVRREALRPTSTRRVWLLLHHTAAQYSAGAYTSARVDVLNVGVLAPQLVPARRRINAVRAMTLPRSAVRFPLRTWFTSMHHHCEYQHFYTCIFRYLVAIETSLYCQILDKPIMAVLPISSCAYGPPFCNPNFYPYAVLGI